MIQRNWKNRLILRDTPFMDLMRRRIFNVLLIANPYDAFMLEDDGRVDEKIFDEYAKLGLRYPPRFYQVASAEEAERELRRTAFNLVICMPLYICFSYLLFKKCLFIRRYLYKTTKRVEK